MAVERNEPEVVELLITHGADLTIQNRDKLTPLELAEKLNCQESIIAALKPKDLSRSSPIANDIIVDFNQTSKEQTRQTIDKRYIREFDFDDINLWVKIEVGRRNGTFKVLIINNATINGALNLMLSEKFIKTFNVSSHFFFIDICVDDSDIRVNEGELKKLENVLHAHKPLIIQWRSPNSSKCCIFYKTPYESIVFLKQDWDDQLTEEQIIEELDNCQFPILLKVLNFGLGGSFHGNLIDTILDVSEEIDTWKLIDYAAKSDDSLSLRYLQLFNWSLHRMNASGSKTLEIASEHASPQSISAILDLPDTNVPHELLPICWQRNLLKLKNFDGLTPTLIAAQYGKTETLEYLINCGVEEDCLEAIELAWTSRFYDKVIVLLNVETPFPGKLDHDACEHAALAKLINAREDFHRAIREDSREKIEDFMKEYPRLKQVLDRSNNSALTTARNAEQWDTYVYLQSKGFRFGNNENSNLTMEEKEQLKQIKHQYFHKPDNSRITFLLSRSKLGHDSHGHDYFAEIKKLYEFLDEIPYASTVMQVLEMSSIQQIVFDFNKESVVDMDPTLTETTAGSCDYVTGNLYIGAKQRLGTLLGTLAHELTHFAMQTVFNNHCNPYTASDMDTKRDFQEIIDRYSGHEEVDSIIKRVYYYKEYEWPSELIVRVPHIVAHYRDEQAMVLRNKAPDLFSFYDSKIEGPFTQFIANSAYFKNQHLNDLLRPVGTPLHSNIRFKSDAILSEEDINRDEICLVLASSLPQLMKNDLLQVLTTKQTLPEIETRYIFTCIDQFENQDVVLKIRNSFKSNIKQTLLVDCSIENKINSVNKEMLWNTVANFDKQKRVVIVTHTRVADLFLKDANKIVETCLVQKEYSWAYLDAESQANLLARTVDFQGYPVALDKLISVDSEYAKEIPLSCLIEGSPITIGKPLPTSYGYDEDYYVERTFRVATKEEDLIFPPNKVTDLLKRVQQEKVLLISNRAGMGKTTILTHFSKKIKETDPSYWVIRLDLNNYTDVLEEEKRRIHIEGTSDAEEKRGTAEASEFLRKNLLKLEFTLEERLFSEMLEKNRIILMFDGFDEVSPFYNTILLSLLADLRKSPIQQLWITTRPFLKKKLVSKLRPISCALQPFSFDNQIEFLMKFWRKSIGTLSDETKLKKFAETLLKRLSKSIADSNRELASVPLQARMLAEAFDQDLIDFYYSNKLQPDLPRKLDLLDVYKRFTHRKYLVYIFEKNSLLEVNLARENLATILSGGMNLRKIHQQLALQVLFPEEMDKLLEFRKKRSLKPEELNRIGIVQYEGEKFYFVHRTFAEYYASDFFMSTLVKPNPRISGPEEPLLDIALRYDFHSVIRNFLNGLLESGEFHIPEENLKFYGGRINQLWTQNWLIEPNAPTILHIAIREGNFNIVQFLLTCLVSSNHIDVLRKLYEAQDQYGKSVWLVAAEEGRVDILEILWLTWKKINDGNIKKLKDILMMRSRNQQTAWCLSVILNRNEIFERIIEYAKGVEFTPEDLIDLVLFEDTYAMRIWYSAALRGQAWVFKKLFAFAKDVGFQASHFKKLTLATNDFDETVWHLTACGNSIEVFRELRKWAAEAEFQLVDVKHVLSSKDNTMESVWHTVAYYNSPAIQSKLRIWRKDVNLSVADLNTDKSTLLDAFWEWGKEAGLTSADIKNELLAENQRGQTIWHLTLQFKDEVISDKLIALIKEDSEIDTKEFFAELFTRTYGAGSLWWVAIKSRLNFNLEMLWKWIREAELTPEEIKRMILEKEQGKTSLHFVTASYDEEMLENIWTYAKESKLTEGDLKSLLMEKDSNELTVWNWMIVIDDLRMFDKLLKLLSKKFSPSPREFTDLLLEKNIFGCTWHYIFTCGRTRLLRRLLQLIDGQDYCKELILSTNEDDKNAFHLAAQLKNSNVFDNLLKWLEKARLIPDELKQLLSSRDRRNRTALVWAVKEKNMKAAMALLELGADVEDLDEKQCLSLRSFMQHRGSCNRDNFLVNIDKHLKELSEKRIQAVQQDSTVNEEVNVFDLLDWEF
ncbi:hypothetical protein Trydic_g23533 [Trypoxylus dichotomus]